MTRGAFSDEVDVPNRIIEALAQQLYARAMVRRRSDTSWSEMRKPDRLPWMDEARALVAPLYREVCDDIERRMMRTEVIDKAVLAFHRRRPRDAGSQPIEEAIHAAWDYALRVRAVRRTLEEAVARLARAGKELGTGPVAVAALVADPAELVRAGLAKKVSEQISVGIAVGLLMQGDREAEAVLVRIHEGWVRAQDEQAAAVQA